MSDSLIISYDNFCPDVPTLIVARKDGCDYTILNKFQGDEAFGIYHLLTGGAELKSSIEVPMKVVREGDDESDYVYCPNCHAHLGPNDFVWEGFYERNWKPLHCIECGQAIIWK